MLRNLIAAQEAAPEKPDLRANQKGAGGKEDPRPSARNASAAGGRSSGGRNDQVGTGSVDSSLPGADNVRAVATLPEFAPEDAAAIAGGAFVVVVQLDEDRYRRRVFLTLAAAEKVAAKARERGHVAHVLLAHVLPLGVVTP